MKGLILKELFSMKNYWKTCVLVLLVVGIPMAMNANQSFAAGFMVGIGIILRILPVAAAVVLVGSIRADI